MNIPDDDDDHELDEILVRVDMVSSLEQELDLSLELVGAEKSHLHKALGTMGLAPQEETGGNCSKEGALAMSAPSILTHCL